jgi:glycosyltransferase involved in cell wall biosynthesis
MSKVLREGPGYDVVHAHVEHLGGLVMLAAWWHGVPGRIVHCHGENRLELSRAGLLRRGFQQVMLIAIQLGMTRGLSCVEAAGDVLFPWAWRDESRCEVLYYPIDERPYLEHEPASDGGAGIREAVGIPAGVPLVVHVGRLCEQKNHRFLLKVMASLLTHHPDARLLLLGDGPDREHLIDQANALGIRDRVVFAGIRSDIPEILMDAADAFVMPSLWEGLPLACMEAQAAGVPTFLSTEISPEASLVAPLVTRLELASGPEEWARRILQVLGRPSALARREACGILANSPVAVKRCVARLEKIYQEEARVSR